MFEILKRGAQYTKDTALKIVGADAYLKVLNDPRPTYPQARAMAASLIGMGQIFAPATADQMVRNSQNEDPNSNSQFNFKKIGPYALVDIITFTCAVNIINPNLQPEEFLQEWARNRLIVNAATNIGLDAMHWAVDKIRSRFVLNSNTSS